MTDNDCIEINTSSDATYWCKRFSISPFTLFQLIKNVGNSASAIEDLLHNHKKNGSLENREEIVRPYKNPLIDLAFS
jgi:hypothetical protein